MKLILSSLFLLILALPTQAQAPVSQVYVFELIKTASGKAAVHSPRLLTKFNEYGYNNQPYFINDHELLLSVQTLSSKQSDIYRFNLLLNTKQQITNTALSEYSPTMTRDGSSVTCVRVDQATTAIQRLYKYELKRQGITQVILPDIKNVGYHTWIDDKTVALFLVNKPNQMALVNIDSKDPLIFSSDVGRCMTTSRQGHLIYVHKISDEYWYIKDYDPLIQKATIITETLPGVEDFAIMPDGSYLMGKGSKLYSIQPGIEKTWSVIGDLKYFGLTSITRLAIRNNRLAIVNQAK